MEEQASCLTGAEASEERVTTRDTPEAERGEDKHPGLSLAPSLLFLASASQCHS